ncbi:CPBP family intramembrane glutamic endopeptidase [Rossellomorea aquimaris]|uniref:CPBP family intramembrane glutamic endopeptidase n=1 Tax=Rossellomorea aquimaris TaxID=189382 RepID=UPI0007D04E81|nr:type II CAAX endopeptidase family protein [Rossellomorea aquimaris]
MKKQGDIIKQLTKKELTFHLYFTQILLLTISFVLGIFLYDEWTEFWGQFYFSQEILTIGMTSGLLVVLLDIFLMRILPVKYYDDGGVNEQIFTNRNTLEIALLALIISVSEEILFRGVIQFHFGIILSSLIFAIIHIRYWAHWFLMINVIILSFWIGCVYEYTNNIVVTIVMHFVIDFLLGLYMRSKAGQVSKEGMSHE